MLIAFASLVMQLAEISPSAGGCLDFVSSCRPPVILIPGTGVLQVGKAARREAGYSRLSDSTCGITGRH